ncbi:MAG: glycosyltransferase family 4 protein [Lachnospiraceae bacterium]|nr:glycosyltransferase family 4 protein [Lachnospiraceae bacterium]
MKIAMVLPHFYPYVGGGELMFYEVAKRLVALGHEVRVVARNVGDEYLGEKNVDGILIRYCKWKSAFGHPLPRTKDIEDVIEWCDVVHTSIFTTAPVTARLARKYGKPSLLTVYEVRGFKWFWTDVFYRALVYFAVEQFCTRQKFDRYHAISEATKRDFLKYCGKRDITRVYLASDLKDEEVKDFSLSDYFGIRNKKVFLYYGRPGRTKGVYVYEKAIAMLKKNGTDLSDVRFCFLLGAEPERPRKEFLKSVVEDGLKGLVKIRPSVSRGELLSCIKQADCVVVPSVTEGFGFSALEACLSGTPLIVSDAGSLPEVVYGKCLKFKNRSEKELAEHIKAVIEKGTDAFDDIEEKSFSVEEMTDGILKIYGEMR